MIEARMDPYLNECRSCELTVVWAEDARANVCFPLDADMEKSAEKGNILLSVGSDGLWATYPSAGQIAGMQRVGLVLYAHHALTCPRKDEWYQVKKHGKATRKVSTKR